MPTVRPTAIPITTPAGPPSVPVAPPPAPPATVAPPEAAAVVPMDAARDSPTAVRAQITRRRTTSSVAVEATNVQALRTNPSLPAWAATHSHQPKGSGISESTIRPIFLCASAALREPQEFFSRKGAKAQSFSESKYPVLGQDGILAITISQMRNALKISCL